MLLAGADLFFSNAHVLWAMNDWQLLFYQFRLPRVVAAIGTGGVLAIAGLLMQNIFQNDLAGPDVLGISQGASLAVALSLLAGVSFGGLVLMGVLGALIYLLFLLWVSRYLASPITLLLVGVMAGFIISAFISTLQVFSNSEALKTFVVWSMGSFGKVSPSQMWYFICLVPVLLIFSMRLANPLNIMLLGSQKAGLMGLNSKRIMLWTIGIAGIATGLSTALCGPIAFVGLVAPHICKWLFTTYRHQVLIPASFLMGAVITLLADFLSTGVIAQTILPINATLSILAAPIILYLIIKKG